MPHQAQVTTNKTIALTATSVLGSSQRRTALTFSAPVSNRITISFGKPAVLDAGDLQLYPAERAVTLTVEAYGTRLQESVSAIAAVAPDVLTVSEVLHFD